ncbi:hypothetical protein V3C99_017027, partial [Haemonchus contortus]
WNFFRALKVPVRSFNGPCMFARRIEQFPDISGNVRPDISVPPFISIMI